MYSKLVKKKVSDFWHCKFVEVALRNPAWNSYAPNFFRSLKGLTLYGWAVAALLQLSALLLLLPESWAAATEMIGYYPNFKILLKPVQCLFALLCLVIASTICLGNVQPWGSLSLSPWTDHYKFSVFQIQHSFLQSSQHLRGDHSSGLNLYWTPRQTLKPLR